jgi:cytochrome b561
MNDTREKLSPVSVVLHWAIALTMIGMVVFGIVIADVLPKSDFKSQMVGLHKSIGMIVIVFATWRLLRRLRIGLPEHLGVSNTWEQHLAKSVHYFLLFATIALPLSGILNSIGSARGIDVFGIPGIPKLLAEKNILLASWSRGTHDVMGKLLLLALTLHIAGALKHHVFDKDGTLKRMLGARVEPPRHV